MSDNDLQRCNKCNRDLPKSEWFPSAWKGRKAARCKSCHWEYYKGRVQDDSNYFLKYQNARRKVGYERITALKSSLGCQRCGYNEHPAALDFHHRDPSQKKMGIPNVWNLSWEKALLEIAKCDLLCSNCHRIHHFEERAAKRKAIAEVTK